MFRSFVLGFLLMAAAPLSALAEKAGVWLDVPFVQQGKNGCGAASLSMLMRYWARELADASLAGADAGEIFDLLYSERAKGIFASDMQDYLQSQGFRTFAFRGRWTDLRQHLSRGRPLVVSLQSGAAESSRHYVVVTGLDWEEETVLINDPARRKLLKVRRHDFEEQWRRGGSWTLLAVPLTADR